MVLWVAGIAVAWGVHSVAFSGAVAAAYLMCDSCAVPTAVGRPLTNAQRQVNALPGVLRGQCHVSPRPTRTARCAPLLSADMRRRFGIVRSAVNETVGKNNALRINAAAKGHLSLPTTPAVLPSLWTGCARRLTATCWRLPSATAVLQLTAWQKVYVRRLTAVGLRRRTLMKQSGITIPTTTLGGDMPIGSIFRLPIHQDTWSFSTRASLRIARCHAGDVHTDVSCLATAWPRAEQPRHCQGAG